MTGILGLVIGIAGIRLALNSRAAEQLAVHRAEELAATIIERDKSVQQLAAARNEAIRNGTDATYERRRSESAMKAILGTFDSPDVQSPNASLRDWMNSLLFMSERSGLAAEDRARIQLFLAEVHLRHADYSMARRLVRPLLAQDALSSTALVHARYLDATVDYWIPEPPPEPSCEQKFRDLLQHLQSEHAVEVREWIGPVSNQLANVLVRRGTPEGLSEARSLLIDATRQMALLYGVDDARVQGLELSRLRLLADGASPDAEREVRSFVANLPQTVDRQDWRLRAHAHLILAQVLMARSAATGIEEAFSTAFAIADEHGGAVDQVMVLGLSNYVYWLSERGLYDEAILQGRRVLELRRSHWGLEAPDTIIAASNLSRALANKARTSPPQEAMLREALDLANYAVVRQQDPSSISAVIALLNRASILIQLGRGDEAQTDLDAALPLVTVPSDVHARLLSVQGERHEESGDLHAARACYRDAEAEFARVLVPRCYPVGWMRVKGSLLDAKLGEGHQVLEDARDGLAILRESLELDHPLCVLASRMVAEVESTIPSAK